MLLKQPTRLDFTETIKQISAGAYHCAAISNTNKCYTWGLNDKGQLGHCSTFQMLPNKSTLVSCGEDYTVLLTVNGELLVSGRLPNRESIWQFEQLAKFEPSVVVH